MLLRHPGGVEAALERVAAQVSIQPMDLPCGRNRVVERIDDEACHTIVNHLRNGAAPKGDDGYAARERFDHYQTERFGPVDRKQQCGRLPEKLALLLFIDLADEFHERVVQKRTDLVLEVVAIRGVDLG